MDPLEFNLEPDNFPPSFYLALAKLVDGLPHSDHESMKRLTEARESAKQKPRRPELQDVEELNAIDWGAVKAQLTKDGLWSQDSMNQCSPMDLYDHLKRSLDSSPPPNWILKRGSASYMGKKIDVGGVHLKLLCRFVDANSEPVNIADLKIACENEHMNTGTLTGYLSNLRKQILRDLNLPKTQDPITCKDGTYRLNLD